MRLNVGCGLSSWGDVRVDLKRGSANILADAQHLPFKDQSFQEVHCISVLEHISSWSQALNEMLRVTKGKVLIEVPVNSDIRKTDVFRLLLPTPKNIRLFFRPQLKRDSI